MQKAENIGVLLTVLMLFGGLIFSCGPGDVLEENNLRYQTDVSFSDGGEDEILTIDIDRFYDCDEDGNFVDPEDPLTDLIANITITVEGEDTPGLEMTGYKVTFQPLQSYDQAGNPITPPAMGPYLGDYDVNIPSNSEVSFWITCMELDMKIYMGSYLNAMDWVFRYKVTIRMSFVDEYDEGRDITINRTLYFGAYNNC